MSKSGDARASKGSVSSMTSEGSGTFLLGTAAFVAVAGMATMWWWRRWHVLGRRVTERRVKTKEVDLRTHTLFVCTTCKVSKREDAPSPVQDGAQPTPTGPEMFRRIVERLHIRGDHPNGLESRDIDKGYEFVAPGGDAVLRVQPQKCLNACRKANCVAVSHPTKYQYHFSMLNADSADDIEDLVKFVDFYCQTDGDAFTKKADRPPRLATNLISRLPPPLRTDDAHPEAA